MAETAGLALGAMSLAALFNNAFECFQFVRIGKDVERDKETYQAKLNLLQLRLSQWGEAVGLDRITEEYQSPLSKPYIETATSALEQIIKLFEEVENKSNDTARRASESEFTTAMKQIDKKAKPAFSTRAKWAVVGHKEYDHLVGSISGLVDGLITTFPAETFTRKQEDIVQADAEELYKEDKSVGELLKEAMGEQDGKMRGKLMELATPSVVHRN